MSTLSYSDSREPFIRCRTLGHAWIDVDSTWTPSWGIPLTLRCERCDMERRDTINNAGELSTRRYTRPLGYLYTKDDPTPTRSQFRLMLLVLRNNNGK
jgi:hypothetical protein